jgi:hypothetical protein
MGFHPAHRVLLKKLQKVERVNDPAYVQGPRLPVFLQLNLTADEIQVTIEAACHLVVLYS